MAVTAIATYDIKSDSRRARVAAMLQVWGTRIQLSVYLLVLDEEDLELLIGKVESLLSPREDSCRFLRQCAPCWESGIQLGRRQVLVREAAFLVL